VLSYPSQFRTAAKVEFISKMGVVVEEADETVFWLDLLIEAGIGARPRMEKLPAEAK